MMFSTKDSDNDRSSANCATQYKGCWWYTGCYNSNLNGPFNHVNGAGTYGMYWYFWGKPVGSIKTSTMMIRKRKL
ncbi:Hypothetical predicted protein [Mytilus galloprovincialis]|nr:Hypothetical predicted protein [Mytilus galloprovincialis]